MAHFNKYYALLVPEPPAIFSIVAHYNEQGSKLTNLDIKFNEVVSILCQD